MWSTHVLHDALTPTVQVAPSSTVSAALIITMTVAYTFISAFDVISPGLQVIEGTMRRSGNETAKSDHGEGDESRDLHGYLTAGTKRLVAYDSK